MTRDATPHGREHACGVLVARQLHKHARHPSGGSLDKHTSASQVRRRRARH